MKLCFLSNYYTHHQKPLCEKLYKLTDKSFAFVETESFDQARLKLGWQQDIDVPFVMQCGDGASEAIDNCDALILGSAPLDMVNARLQAGKPVFKYSERVFKSGYNYAKWLPRLVSYYKNYGKHKNMYLLAASAYASSDFAKHGTFRGKSYKWGYFPETYIYDTDKLFSGKDPKKILWCGRLIGWKHAELAVETAKRLRAEGVDFTMDIIGTGEEEASLKAQIEANGLFEAVQLTGAKSPLEVRAAMERAGIYIFTSDFNEGWGAVLNEAMNSGCAVVASHAIGAVPFLVKHGQNALIYQNGNTSDLYAKVRALLTHPEKQKMLGENAYKTIKEEWNAETAAERLLLFTEQIKQSGSCKLFKSGPCSAAPIIKNGWFKADSFEIPWMKD